MNIPSDCVTQCPAGEKIDSLVIMPGDFILTTSPGFLHTIIKIGQSFRFNKRLATYTHCALVISKQGDLIEADGGGIQYRHLREYIPRDYVYVHTRATPEDREEVVTFAKSCSGEPYGWLTALSIGISLLSGLKFSFGFEAQAVCSGLVARALERTSFIPPVDASHISPALLAQLYQV